MRTPSVQPLGWGWEVEPRGVLGAVAAPGAGAAPGRPGAAPGRRGAPRERVGAPGGAGGAGGRRAAPGAVFILSYIHIYILLFIYYFL